MQTKIALSALTATLLVPLPLARADVGCFGYVFRFVPDGTTNAEGRTRTGQPCQMGFGVLGADIEDLQIIVRPSHGVLGISKKEANRRYVAYAPTSGFVGHDRFEVFVQ